MASAPVFYTVPRIGAGIVPGTADTSLTAPTNKTTIITGAASSTMIHQIRLMQIASTSAPGCVNLFLNDGTTQHLFDQYTFATATLSTSVEKDPVDLPYTNIILPSNSWTIEASVTVSGGASAFKVIALGSDAS